MLLISLLLTATTLWLLLKYFYSYWERTGFPYIKGSIPFGNLGAVVKREKSFGVAIYDLYNSTKEPLVGIYLLFRPAILVRDAEMVKNILTKDFNSFHDRGIYVDEKDEFSASLFALKGSSWRALRAKLTPTFTSGKLKNMFVTIEDTGKAMQAHLESIVPENGEVVVELKELMSKYAMDIIASVIFGLEVNSFTDPNNEFQKASRAADNPGIRINIGTLCAFLCPKLLELFPFLKGTEEVREIMLNIVKKTIEFREKEKVTRKDFMQLLLQLRNTGKVGGDGIWDVETVAENLKSMTIEQCAAQVFLFWIAGYDTSASATSFCLYELTQNPDIMNKVQNEIDEVLERHNGQLTYDSIQDMKYLDRCIMETVRKYPGLPILNRECTENFPVEGTDLVIQKGTAIIISLLGLHRDPNYFPDPLKFDPDRYAESNRNYTDAAYLPFGEGPRACIGIRLGKINAKVGVVMMLRKFRLEAKKKEIEFDNYSPVLKAKGGILVKISRKH